MGRIVVDYEELHRLAGVWAAASRALAGQAAAVAAIAADPAVAANAALDPVGAARVERHLLSVLGGRHGLLHTGAVLALDAARLDAVVLKEQLVDGLPAGQLVACTRWLAAAAWQLSLQPGRAPAVLRDGAHRAVALVDAAATYAMPFAEPLFARVAPSARFRLDVTRRRPVEVEPVTGLPLKAIAAVLPDGPGRVAVSAYRPSWMSRPAASVADAVRRVGELENAPDALLAVQRVTSSVGRTRYLVLLPGMRTIAPTANPQDLPDALDALALGSSAYTRCVREALDAAGVPDGADVMLVGHSEGGIVAMDLAADPAFNGARVHVTRVVAAGSPISSKTALPGTDVLSAENVNDLVPHLDAVDSGTTETPGRLIYQFSDDRHDLSRNHDPALYADHLEVLGSSPNPLVERFVARSAPYFADSDPAASGAVATASTTVFSLRDD